MTTQSSSDLNQLLHYELELFKKIVEITKSIICILDLEQLLNTTVNLIRDYLDYELILIYLFDDTKKFAVARAATGEVGRILLDKEYKVEISNTTLIGRCISNEAAYIVTNRDEDIVEFQNPILPDVQSVAILPLVHQDEVIGALEVQDFSPAFLSERDLSALQVLADYLAIAIKNARLFGKM